MGSDRVRQLTVEPAHVVVHRNKNNERLATLEYILGILNKHISHIASESKPSVSKHPLINDTDSRLKLIRLNSPNLKSRLHRLSLLQFL
jgi:hypothetical protein